MINNEKTLVIITGCNRGLGKELLNAFQLFPILCINRKKYHENDYVLDLSSRDIIFDSLLENTEQYSTLIFINNASVLDPVENIINIDPSEIDKSFYVNYINPAKVMMALLQLNKKMVIINITSGAAFTANTKLALYSASKAAMHRFIDILSEEEKMNTANILIKNFDPGRMDTEMQANLIDKKNLDRSTAMLTSPREVAEKLYVEIIGVLNERE